MKDCTTCKYGYEDEHWGIPMCHHPKRWSEDCVDFNMHKEKHLEGKSDKSLEEAAENAMPEEPAYFADEFTEDGPKSEPVYDVEQMKAMYMAGAEWQKERMMKDAVEVRVQTSPLNGPLGISAYCCNFPSEHPFYRCKSGDKVRIIIVKED